MRVRLLGVRGSTPSPGPEFVRVGGHTSCVALAHDGDGEPPSLVLDAGTGIRNLDPGDGRPFRGTILLGHLHWDHTQGLPFFRAGDREGARVRVFLPDQEGSAMSVLERFMSPPHFPITPTQLRGDWLVEELVPGEHLIEGFRVLALEIPHKGGRTFGFRVVDPAGGGSLAYLSDHSPVTLGPGPCGFGPYHEAAMALASGVDVLIHDAQYTADELAARASFGHSAIDYPIGLAEAAGARSVLLFHHDPWRTDDEVLSLAAAAAERAPMPVRAAVEGDVLELA